MKVWLYYRLSRDEDDELNSLTNQRKIIYEYAVTNGHEVVGESFDDNVSGMHFNREGIDKIYEVVEMCIRDSPTGLLFLLTPQSGYRFLDARDSLNAS